MEPNQELPPRSLHDECGTKEHTLCKSQWHSQSNSQVGSLEVSFTATDCCDEKPLGTRIVEPESCSFRTCRKGLSAFWERTFLHVRYSFISWKIKSIYKHMILVSVIAVSTIPRSSGMENAEMTRCAAVKVLGQGKMEQIQSLK